MPGSSGRSATSSRWRSAASRGTTWLVATPTLARRFNSSRALTAASPPPPTTRGGLPSKLTRMGKVRISLSSNRHPLGRRIGEALRRKLDLEPVELRGHDDLAAKPRALIDLEGAVEHLKLFSRRRHELIEPMLSYPHMANRADAGTAAFVLDRDAPVADQFHAPPALEGFESVCHSVGPTHSDEHD